MKGEQQGCRLEIKSYISQIFQEEEPSQDEKEKQQLLKKEIFDCYNQQEDILNQFYQYFVKFAMKVKNRQINEPELSLLTITEIRQMIAEFKQSFKNGSKQEDEDSKKDIAPIIPQSFINQELYSKVFYKNGAWDYELMINEMNCHRQKPVFKEERQNIVIKFKDHFIKKDKKYFGLTSKLSLWIQIESLFSQRKVVVNRSIEDFIYLQQTLRNIYPHSFIPLLKISQNELQSISESNNKMLITKCFNFLNQVTMRAQLFENIHTFRFVAEETYSNFVLQKNNAPKKQISSFNRFKNNKGVVSIRVSQKTESTKKDCIYKSYVWEKVWSTVNKLISQAINCSSGLTGFLGNINDQFSLLMSQSLGDPKIAGQYSSFKKLLTCTQEIMNLFSKTINQSQSFLRKLKDDFAIKAQKNWQEFNFYKEKIVKNSEKYQAKRKEFLEQQLSKIQSKQINNNNNMFFNTKIGELNLQESMEQQVWANSTTKWYGYLNHEFICTYRAFLNRDQIKFNQQMRKIGLVVAGQIEQDLKSIRVIAGQLLLDT